MKEKYNRKTLEKRLKILIVIHGYPPYYMAGSEVYTFTMCKELSKKHEVIIFTRTEDEFKEAYTIQDTVEQGCRIIRVNKPGRDYTFRSKYQDDRIAQIFQQIIDDIVPDIVHINHLSHLSTQIIDIIKEREIPILFTLHDFWMICIKGQLLNNENELCPGPSLRKCAYCNRKYFISQENTLTEIGSWMDWMRDINEKIDLFIAPSLFLKTIYEKYGIPEEKIIHMDYGFDKRKINAFNLNKNKSDKIRFGYLGRIIPVKGIATLIDAFNKVNHSKAELNIYGKIPSSFLYLKSRVYDSVVTFKGGYNYSNINEVLSNIDVLVVPSIWYENSPLVIHEAFLARIPVIASNLGGMAELISHEKNGLLFEPGNVEDLIEKMNIFIQNPETIEKYSQETPVRSIQEDVDEIVKLYHDLIQKTETVIIAK